MDYNLILKILLYFALISTLGVGVLAIIKKRFSRKILMNFFVFGLYASAVKIFEGYMIRNFEIEDSKYYLVISLVFFAVTLAFINYSLYLIKEEKEHLL